MSKISVNPDPGDEVQLSELFHENTKIYPDTHDGFDSAVQYRLPEIHAMASAGRRYRGLDRIRLQAGKPASISLHDAMTQRRTLREFSEKPLSTGHISSLLLETNGVTGVQKIPGKKQLNLRSTPSAGGLYPIEMYLFVNRATDVRRGLHHFDPHSGELALLKPDYDTDELSFCCCQQVQATTASLVLVFTAVFQRTLQKYGDRGYRYALLDIGHAAQNLLLSCTAQGLACMTSGGFFDDALNSLIGVDGVDESAMYIAFIGHPK